MAIFGAWADGYLRIKGIDLSDHVLEMGITVTDIELPDDKHGDNTAIVTTGLEKWGIAVIFVQDFSIGKVDDVLKSAFSIGTTTDIIIGANDESPTPTNPWFRGECNLVQYVIAKGVHGSYLTAMATFSVAGPLYRITSSQTGGARMRPLPFMGIKVPKGSVFAKRPKAYDGRP